MGIVTILRTSKAGPAKPASAIYHQIYWAYPELLYLVGRLGHPCSQGPGGTIHNELLFYGMVNSTPTRRRYGSQLLDHADQKSSQNRWDRGFPTWPVVFGNPAHPGQHKMS